MLSFWNILHPAFTENKPVPVLLISKLSQKNMPSLPLCGEGLPAPQNDKRI
jgi:hypothetical protein